MSYDIENEDASSKVGWQSSLATAGGAGNNLDLEKKRFYGKRARERLAK